MPKANDDLRNTHFLIIKRLISSQLTVLKELRKMKKFIYTAALAVVAGNAFGQNALRYTPNSAEILRGDFGHSPTVNIVEFTPFFKRKPHFSSERPSITTVSPMDSVNKKIPFFQLGAVIGPDLVQVQLKTKESTGNMMQNTTVSSTLGFHIGAALRMNFTRNIFLLPQVIFAFRGGDLDFRGDSIGGKINFSPLTLNIPAHLVFKTSRFKINPAAFFGIRYIADISESDLSNPIKIKRSEFNIEAGLGLSFRFWKINLMPQMGTFIGLSNLLRNDPNSFNDALESIKRRTFELRFLFF